jgi:SAM-dependent methyltransferase
MKESDIRPEALLNRYLELSAADAEHYFQKGPRHRIPCIACGDDRFQHEFTKNGFDYSSCAACGSLFLNPRPEWSAFEALYRDSISGRYWAEQFFPAVAEARRERIFKPRAEKLSAMCTNKGIAVERLIDVGAGYGIMLDEWRRLHPDTRLLAIEPSASLANSCREKGLDVVEESVENVTGCQGSADLVVCFEVLEHAYDPLAFVRALSELARPGGYVFVSTLGVDGFDIQVLWEKSNSIFPPHHINFLSVAGFRHLFDRAGLVDVDVTTPGVLDIDIVRNAVKKHPEILASQRFVGRLIADERLSAGFQSFLSENCLSSHTWILGRKPIH